MFGNIDLASKIREMALTVIPSSIRDEVLIELDLMVVQTQQKVIEIMEKIPGESINLEGQIRSRLLQTLRSERITNIVYERYRAYVGEAHCYTYKQFLRQEINSKSGTIGSPFHQFLDVESRGLKPGTKINLDRLDGVLTIQNINRECRVVLVGGSCRGVKPSACTPVKGNDQEV